MSDTPAETAPPPPVHVPHDPAAHKIALSVAHEGQPVYVDGTLRDGWFLSADPLCWVRGGERQAVTILDGLNP